MLSRTMTALLLFPALAAAASDTFGIKEGMAVPLADDAVESGAAAICRTRFSSSRPVRLATDRLAEFMNQEAQDSEEGAFCVRQTYEESYVTLWVTSPILPETAVLAACLLNPQSNVLVLYAHTEALRRRISARGWDRQAPTLYKGSMDTVLAICSGKTLESAGRPGMRLFWEGMPPLPPTDFEKRMCAAYTQAALARSAKKSDSGEAGEGTQDVCLASRAAAGLPRVLRPPLSGVESAGWPWWQTPGRAGSLPLMLETNNEPYATAPSGVDDLPLIHFFVDTMVKEIAEHVPTLFLPWAVSSFPDRANAALRDMMDRPAVASASLAKRHFAVFIQSNCGDHDSDVPNESVWSLKRLVLCDRWCRASTRCTRSARASANAAYSRRSQRVTQRQKGH